jgi:hypothetical protein
LVLTQSEKSDKSFISTKDFTGSSLTYCANDIFSNVFIPAEKVFRSFKMTGDLRIVNVKMKLENANAALDKKTCLPA